MSLNNKNIENIDINNDEKLDELFGVTEKIYSNLFTSIDNETNNIKQRDKYKKYSPEYTNQDIDLESF